MGTRLAHRLVGVGRPQDPGRQRDRRPGQPAGIARAVETLAELHRDPLPAGRVPAD